MEYIHVKNLEKYHPGYKDRELQWAKIYINLADGDPDTELINNEIDWARFIKMILLELRAKKPLPNIDSYWTKKGFDLKKRPISLTLQVLHNFISCVEQEPKDCVLDKEKDKEKDKENGCVTDFFNYFLLKTKTNLKLTFTREDLIKKRLKDGFNIEQLKTAVDNFIQDDWPERSKHLDLIYCIGIRNKVDNLEKWLNCKSKEAQDPFKLRRPL